MTDINANHPGQDLTTCVVCKKSLDPTTIRLGDLIAHKVCWNYVKDFSNKSYQAGFENGVESFRRLAYVKFDAFFEEMKASK